MPRICTTAERDIIAGSGVNHILQVFVEGPDGDMRDCSSLGTLGLDLLDGITWSATIDTPVMTGTLTLGRNTNDDSAAPLMGASSINRNGLGAYAPFFEKGRKIIVVTGTVPQYANPTSDQLKQVFIGRIDAVHSHADPMTADISDMGVWLADASLKVLKQYADFSGVPGVGPLLGAMLQEMINDAIPTSPPTLYEPETSSFQPFSADKESPGPLLTALRNWAQEVGWDVRYTWDASDNFVPTLFNPNRDKTVPDWTFSPDEYTKITNLTSDITNIRNEVTVYYKDDAGDIQSVTVTDDASIAKYGGPSGVSRLWQFSSGSIKDATTARALANAVLNDLSDALADHEIELPYFWPIALGDLCLFKANTDTYDSDQTLAVVGFTHNFPVGSGDGTTTIQARGKVAGAYRTWISKGSKAGSGSGASTLLPPTAMISEVDENNNNFTVKLSGVGDPSEQRLDYRYRISDGVTMPAWGAWVTTPDPTTDLPLDVQINRLAVRTITIEFVTRDTLGVESIPVSFQIGPSMPSIDTWTGKPINVVDTDGYYSLRGTDPNTMAASDVDSRAWPVNGMFRYAGDSADGVVETAAKSFTAPGYLDTSRRPVLLRDPVAGSDVAANDVNVGQARARGGFANSTGLLVSTATDSRARAVNTGFQYGVDGADGVLESSIKSFAHPSYLDASRRPVILRDPTAGADVAANDINVGQARARGGFTGTTGQLVSTAIDDRSRALNTGFQYSVDTAVGVLETSSKKFVDPTGSTAAGSFVTSGAGAGYTYYDRTTSSGWLLYAYSGYARIFNSVYGGDTVTISESSGVWNFANAPSIAGNPILTASSASDNLAYSYTVTGSATSRFQFNDRTVGGSFWNLYASGSYARLYSSTFGEVFNISKDDASATFNGPIKAFGGAASVWFYDRVNTTQYTALYSQSGNFNFWTSSYGNSAQISWSTGNWLFNAQASFASGKGFYSQSTATDYLNASLMLRESNLTGTSGATPPRLSFHWGGVTAAQITVEAADPSSPSKWPAGRIAIRSIDGTAYQNFVASAIWATDHFDAATNGYYINGKQRMFDEGGLYTHFLSGGASGAIYLGNNGLSYYDNDTHYFRTAAAGTNYRGIWSSLSLQLFTPLDLNRATSVNASITFYGQSYTGWREYMAAPGAGNGPLGIVPRTGSIVTSWARRSFIENAAGYGWIWEANTISSTDPVIKMELSSVSGLLNNIGGYAINGVNRVMDSAGSYTILYSPTPAVGSTPAYGTILLGGSADARNYYQNTEHRFRLNDGTLLATLNSSGLFLEAGIPVHASDFILT